MGADHVSCLNLHSSIWKRRHCIFISLSLQSRAREVWISWLTAGCFPQWRVAFGLFKATVLLILWNFHIMYFGHFFTLSPSTPPSSPSPFPSLKSESSSNLHCWVQFVLPNYHRWSIQSQNLEFLEEKSRETHRLSRLLFLKKENNFVFSFGVFKG